MPTQTWIVATAGSYDLPDAVAARLQVIGGTVDVVHRDEPGVHLEVSGVVGAPLEVTLEDGVLSVGYADLPWEGWLKRLGSHRGADLAGVSCVVGPGVKVKVGAVGAAVSVSGLTENVSLASANGPLAGRGLRAGLVARTVSGAVTVTDHGGPIRVNSVSGPVALSGAIAKADVATVSGGASVRTTTGTSVIRAQSVSAAIDITIPPDSGLALTARTLTGAVVVDGVDRRKNSLPGTTSVDERTGTEVGFVELYSVSGALSVGRPGLAQEHSNAEG